MYLVLQSPDPLPAEAVSHIGFAVGTFGKQEIGANAVRMMVSGLDGRQRCEIDAYCQARRIDWALVPDRKLSDYGLLAMDMDSTLITIECIDEIADYAGLKAEVSAVTEAAMRGEIKDFKDSLKRRVALLKGLDAGALEKVYAERLRLSPGAEAMLEGARKAGLKTLLVSGGFTFFTDKLQERLGLDFTSANLLDIDGGKLTGKVRGEIIDAQQKANAVADICAGLHIPTSDVIVMGDGSNDLKMMSLAGLSIAYRAKPEVREKASLSFDFVGLDGLLNLFP
ncbi:MAG: phosphoserine phosphatase SerB [Candidatus Protistobacter heckmanni]|nr:phosphoserine phosphatase SerB [Candidatus Protistobacter heckmanni]